MTIGGKLYCHYPTPLNLALLALQIRFVLTGQLLGKDRYGEIACLNALNYAKLEDRHDFVDTRARPQGVSDVPPRTGGVRMSVRGVEGDAQELDFFKRQDASRVNSGTQGHEVIGPNIVERLSRLRNVANYA